MTSVQGSADEDTNSPQLEPDFRGMTYKCRGVDYSLVIAIIGWPFFDYISGHKVISYPG